MASVTSACLTTFQPPAGSLLSIYARPDAGLRPYTWMTQSGWLETYGVTTLL